MKKFDSDIEAVISKVKGSGFWCMATETRLRNIIHKLVARDLPACVIGEVIADFWTMASAEYGE